MERSVRVLTRSLVRMWYPPGPRRPWETGWTPAILLGFPPLMSFQRHWVGTRKGQTGSPLDGGQEAPPGR